MDTQGNVAPNQRGGVTLTEVHGPETNVSTISAAVVTTRSNTEAPEHVVEHRKLFPENHWQRLYNLQTDLQKRLELTTTPTDLGLQQILKDTTVTIALSKLLKISPKLHEYIQQPTLADTTTNLDVHTTTNLDIQIPRLTQMPSSYCGWPLMAQ